MDNAAAGVTARLQRMKALAQGPAPEAAAKAMGVLAVATVQLELSRRSHAKGTPAGPPGEPPSVVDGHLRRSITVTPPLSMGSHKYMVAVGGTIVYARIHELGGVIVPRSARMLHWVDASGTHHFARQVTIPPRPYLRPAAEKLKASGQLGVVAGKAWWAVMNNA